MDKWQQKYNSVFQFKKEIEKQCYPISQDNEEICEKIITLIDNECRRIESIIEKNKLKN
jgi:K+/H+ antiporter YhaU regulatory subunit KhtT